MADGRPGPPLQSPVLWQQDDLSAWDGVRNEDAGQATSGRRRVRAGRSPAVRRRLWSVYAARADPSETRYFPGQTASE
jgi:hypothetical protein